MGIYIHRIVARDACQGLQSVLCYNDKGENYRIVFLPSGHSGDAPHCSLITMGAKAIFPSTQCFRIESMIPDGKWIWRSHRKTMLCGSCKQRKRLFRLLFPWATTLEAHIHENAQTSCTNLKKMASF